MTFEPKFSYTNEIVGNLTYIAEARSTIINAPLIPKWEVSLRRDALLRSAHSSTAIEGNRLSLEEVSDLAAGRKIMVGRKDKQEVLNYLNTLEKLPEFTDKPSFEEKDFLKIQKMITDKTLDNHKYEGMFRDMQVVVGNRLTGEITFMPPPVKEVIPLVNDFIAWLNAEQTNEIDAVIEAGIVHYEIARIHPFVDGNGRTARVMATLVLLKRGFDVKRFFTLDDYYDSDRASYYAALKSVNQDTLDLTSWLEYFTEGVAVSIKAVEQRVTGLSKDIKILKERGQVSLTERQMKVVEHVVENGAITNREIRQMFNITNRPAHDELVKLVEMKVLKETGKGRSTKYVFL